MRTPPKEWMPRERWDALVAGEDCQLCNVIRLDRPEDEYAIKVADLQMSRLSLWKNQFVPGYCTLVCHKHVREPYHLSPTEQAMFFEDMLWAAQALERVFSPVKMNFMILGNEVPHLHAHLVPRYYGDPAPSRPIEPDAQVVTLTASEYQARVKAIRAALDIR